MLVLPRTDPTQTIQVSFIQKVIRRQYTLIPNSDDSLSEFSTSKQAPPSLVIERLDKHDRHLDKLDHQFERIEQKFDQKFEKFDQKFEKVEASITELKLEVQKGFHNIESKFQTILSQWLFRAAQLVSSITFTFLILSHLPAIWTFSRLGGLPPTKPLLVLEASRGAPHQNQRLGGPPLLV